MRIAFREWRVRWDQVGNAPILQSTFMPVLWTTSSQTADELPEGDTSSGVLGTLHGIHAALPWTTSPFLSRRGWPNSSAGVRLIAVGAVDTFGRIVEHDDGVLRAEHVKILALRLVELTFLPFACEHQNYWVASRRGLRDEPFWVLRREHVIARVEYSRPMKHACATWVAPPGYEQQFVLSLEDVEARLLQWYEVPRLGADEGPWLPPLGAGPTARPSSS